MDALVSLVKIWRARMAEVIRPILGRGPAVGDGTQESRSRTERY